MPQAVLEAESALLPREAFGSFVDRRAESVFGVPSRERRQFTNSHEGLSPAAAELARGIDRYKAEHRRRFIDFEEMLAVIESLGYSK
ncbi:MAG: hypothetical protein ACRCT8_02085 [Lacipirellulaceae bacterium]